MSQPSRPRSRGTAQRRRRDVKLDRPVPLETAEPDGAGRRDLSAAPRASRQRRRRRTRTWGPSRSRENTTATTLDTMAPITSVSELTPISSFGGDIVTIAAGPRRRLRRTMSTRSHAGRRQRRRPARSTTRA